MQNFRNLAVWQKAHQLVLAVYSATSNYPRSEAYGLTSQTRRTAIQIPSKIADGSGLGSDVEFAKYLQVANGSASDVDYLLLLAKDLNYLEEAAYTKLADSVVEVKRMIYGLIRTMKS